MTSVELKNITYTYNKNEPSARVALNDVSFTLRDGDFVGLIGHTGSGKSTLVQIIAGLLPPLSGELLIDGGSFPDYKTAAREIRRKTGLVFQYPEHQLFEETVYKDIAFGPTNLGLSADETDERVREAAGRVGLSDSLLEKSPFELSGGQKRRAAIAGVVAMRPELLILDEPTAGLDPEGRDELLEMLKKLHEDWCKTIVLVSHSMEDIAKTVSSVAVMNAGSLCMQGSVAEVFARGDELRSMGLNTPQISRIVDGLIAEGLPLDRNIFTVEAAADAIAKLLGGGKDA